jgi:hypothetical protein
MRLNQPQRRMFFACVFARGVDFLLSFNRVISSFGRHHADSTCLVKLAEARRGLWLVPYDKRIVVMAYQAKHSSAKMSRRSVLRQAAAVVAGAATIVAINANSAKADLLPQKAVQYQNIPKADRQCDGCGLFVAPNACKNVAGEISPKGWCILWRKI